MHKTSDAVLAQGGALAQGGKGAPNAASKHGEAMRSLTEHGAAGRSTANNSEQRQHGAAEQHCAAEHGAAKPMAAIAKARAGLQATRPTQQHPGTTWPSAARRSMALLGTLRLSTACPILLGLTRPSKGRSKLGEMLAAERIQHTLADPKIKDILRDPVVSKILDKMQTDPSAAQPYRHDPDVSAKIEKLIAAGVLQVE